MEHTKRRYILFLLLAVWLAVAARYFYSGWLLGTLKDSLRVLPLPVEAKYKMIDNELYVYVREMAREIPPGALVVIKNISQGLQEQSPDWLKAAYDTQRAGYYYLAPRPVVLTDARYTRTDTYRIVYRLEPAVGRVFFKLYRPGEEEGDVH